MHGEFAKAILCLNQDEKNCNKCKSCVEFDSNNNPDFIIIDNQDETIKIEQIRQMQSRILEKPIISEKKVYVINNADNMTKEAQNCLLKTLEEPPEYVIIILIGTNESNFLNTIKSRCTKIKFEPIEKNILTNIIKEKFPEVNIFSGMINASEGSIKKALKIYENKEIYEQVDKVFNNIEQYTLLDLLNKIDVLYKNKENILEILDYINIILFEKAKVRLEYLNYINAIERAKKSIKSSNNYDMTIDKLLFDIWGER